MPALQDVIDYINQQTALRIEPHEERLNELLSELSDVTANLTTLTQRDVIGLIVSGGLTTINAVEQERLVDESTSREELLNAAISRIHRTIASLGETPQPRILAIQNLYSSCKKMINSHAKMAIDGTPVPPSERRIFEATIDGLNAQLSGIPTKLCSGLMEEVKNPHINEFKDSPIAA